MSRARPTVIAQISDPHVKRPGELAYGVVDTAVAFARCIDFLRTLEPRPDIVVVSGDLVDLGHQEEYAHFRALCRGLDVPVAVLPGNHDDRTNFQHAFADHTYLAAAGPLDARLAVGDLDLLLLDSSVPGKPYGTLGGESLERLERWLSQDVDRPALILLHHPPFLTGIRHMDVQNLLNADALAAIVSRHPRVRLVAAGHVHRATMTIFAGIPAVIAAGTSHAVALDLAPDGPPAFRLETPGLFLHVWTPGDDGGRLVSHALPIGDFAGPHPFFDAQGNLL